MFLNNISVSKKKNEITKEYLESKEDILDILNIESQAEVMEWISQNGLEGNRENFVLSFHIGDITYDCICYVDLSGSQAIVKCLQIIETKNGQFNSKDIVHMLHKDLVEYNLE